MNYSIVTKIQEKFIIFALFYFSMTTPDGAQIVVGDRGWLDGLTGGKDWSKWGTVEENDQSNNIDDFFYQFDDTYIPRCMEYINEVLQDNKDKEKLSIKVLGRLSQCTPKRRHHPQLILAAGVKTQPGQLFTLWWSSERFTSNNKTLKTE